MTEAINFSKVEALRKHFQLTKHQFSELMGVTRMTYHGWLNGKQPKEQNAEVAKTAIKKLLGLYKEERWPTVEALQATSGQRYEMLLEELEKEE